MPHARRDADPQLPLTGKPAPSNKRYKSRSIETVSAQRQHSTLSTRKQMAPLRIGTLLVGSEIQFMDTSAVDILAMHSKDYLKSISVPEAFVAQGEDMEFLYVAEQSSGLFSLTGGLKVTITVRAKMLLQQLCAR